MQEQLDAHENFEVLSDGTMKFDDFIAFRSIILRQMLRKFNSDKERLAVQAIDFLKKNEERNYVTNYLEMTSKYSQALMEMTDAACKHLEFDRANFAGTVQSINKSKELAAKMQKAESEVKALHVQQNAEFTGTKEDALNCFKYRAGQEMQMIQRLKY